MEEKKDELEVDFGWIKNIFKRKKEQSRQKPQKEEEISINLSSIKEFFIKYRVVFLILIPFILAVFVRVQNEPLSMTDEWAKQTAYN